MTWETLWMANAEVAAFVAMMVHLPTAVDDSVVPAVMRQPAVFGAPWSTEKLSPPVPFPPTALRVTGEPKMGLSFDVMVSDGCEVGRIVNDCVAEVPR